MKNMFKLMLLTLALALLAGCKPAMAAPVGQVATGEVTCASEGYTGTQLEWCKNICERGYTGATLDAWIHRWTLRYRALPYCAVD